MSDTEQQPLTERQQEQWRELVNKPHEDLSDGEVTSKIRLSMRRRFDHPEWVLCYEFPAPNGRQADCIAVNTFPSRNFKVLGFEFKASRSDWLNELNDGEKADYFVKAVDEWYVVAGRRGIVKEEELPEGWGLLELKDNRDDQLWKLVESDLTDHQQGEPDRQFWARFVKKAVGKDANYGERDLREAKRRGYEEAKEDEIKKRRAGKELEKLEEKAESYDKLAERFDFVSRWGAMSDESIERIERAYRFLRSIENDNAGTVLGQIDSIERSAEMSNKRIEQSLDEVREEVEKLQKLADGDFVEVADVGAEGGGE